MIESKRTPTEPEEATSTDRTHPSPPRLLRARDVGELIAMRGYPCISLLMPTTPADEMTTGDRQTLWELVAQIESVLGEHGLPSRDRLVRQLTDLADQASRQSTDEALALYVSLAVNRALSLPLSVTPKAVVEQTFATRDLVNVMHHTPPHLIVSLQAGCAHIYRAMAGTLTPVFAVDLRIDRPTRIAHARINRGGDDEPSLATLMAELDKALGDERVDHPSPLVLVGSPALLDAFTRTSSHLHRLAGRVPPDQSNTPDRMMLAAEVLLEQYLHSRQGEALDLLGTTMRTRPTHVAIGIEACWQAAHTSKPRMLIVDEGYSCAGRAHGNAPKKAVVGGGSDTDSIHDLVDDLIETVIERGGLLALVDHQSLPEPGNVALITTGPIPTNTFDGSSEGNA